MVALAFILLCSSGVQSPAVQSCPSFARIADVPGKGRGVVATEDLKQHTVVGDYVGEHLTEKEKDRRYLASYQHERTKEDIAWLESREERGQTATGDYLFGVTGVDVFIDAEDEERSNWTRFLNHDSDPNLRVKSLPSAIDGNPRVFFVASRDISKDEELCFSYGDDYWRPDDDVA
mmetsp:Transcript_13579/g.26984  ORF Transcript_13579/g.26984 Transcript_13579/m.26984 type:complete len:176 (+) Transcript_13579:213-740(+)